MAAGFSQKLLLLLKQVSHNSILVDQILSKFIVSRLIHDTLTWNCVIRAYSNCYSTPIKSILIYNHFIASVYPDNHTYPALLKACSRLHLILKGKELHSHVIKIGVFDDVYVQNSLVHFYGIGKELLDARNVFDKMPVTVRDIASWNSLLSAYYVNGDSRGVLVLYKGMIFERIQPDKISLVIALSACAETEELECVRTVHSYVTKIGLDCNLILNNAMLNGYAKCKEMDASLRVFNEMGSRRDLISSTILINGFVKEGMVNLARSIFDQIIEKDVALWNSMIHGYVGTNHPNEALDLFKKMDDEGFIPDENIIVDALAACASITDLRLGRLIHRYIYENNVRVDVYVRTALINMYSKCGSLKEALLIFYKTSIRDVFTWTTIIEALSNNGHGNEALRMFSEMEEQKVKPTEATFVSVLMACSRYGLVNQGCELFQRMTRFYDMEPKTAHFGSVIDLLSRAGLLNQAMELVKCMPVAERVVGFKSLLNAAISQSAFDIGEKIVKELVELDSESCETRIMVSNLYAMGGQWAQVAATRRFVKQSRNMRKEPGVSSVESEKRSNFDFLSF